MLPCAVPLLPGTGRTASGGKGRTPHPALRFLGGGWRRPGAPLHPPPECAAGVPRAPSSPQHPGLEAALLPAPPRSLLSPVCRCPCPPPQHAAPRIAQLRLPPAHLQPRRPRRSVRGAAEPCGAGGSSAGPGGEGKGLGRKGKGCGGGGSPPRHPPSILPWVPPSGSARRLCAGGGGWRGGGWGIPPEAPLGELEMGARGCCQPGGGTHTPNFWQNHLMVAFVLSPVKAKSSSAVAAQGWERGGQGIRCPPTPNCLTCSKRPKAGGRGASGGVPSSACRPTACRRCASALAGALHTILLLEAPGAGRAEGSWAALPGSPLSPRRRWAKAAGQAHGRGQLSGTLPPTAIPVRPGESSSCPQSRLPAQRGCKGRL